jgi:hypothetical protein
MVGIQMNKLFYLVCTLSFLALIGGCASKGVKLPPKTIFLGEVSHFLTPQLVAGNELAPGNKIENLASKLRDWGFTSEEVANNRVVVVRAGIYWNNTISGIKRDMLRVALIPNGLEVRVGNIIEVDQGSPPDHPITINRVRAENLKAGNCYYDELPTGLVKGLMGAIGLVGPSGAATLYCKGIENEGWQRPATYWRKLPSP